MQLFEQSVPTRKKEAGSRLPRDASEWRPSILEDALTKYPFLHDYVTEVHIQQLDADSGNGVGNIMVTNQPPDVHGGKPTPTGQVIYIPFVISGRTLKRMEIFGTGNNEFFPVTEERVRRTLMDPNAQFYASDHKSETFDDNLVPPPRTYSEFISKMGGVSQDFLDRKISELDFVPGSYFEGISVHEKTASCPSVRAVQFHPRDTDVRIHILNDDWSEKVATLSHPAAAAMLGEPVDRVRTISLTDPAEGVKTASQDVIECDSPTWGSAYLSGRLTDGMLFPNVIKIAGDKTDEHLFVSKDGDYATTPLPQLLKSASAPSDIRSHSTLGMSFFSIGDQITEPVYVSEVYGERGEEKLAVMAGLGKKIILTKAPVDRITKVAEGKYLIPKTARLIGIRQRHDISITKKASESSHIESRNGYHYFCDLPAEWEKAGQGLNAYEAALCLAGLGDPDADNTIKKAAKKGRVDIAVCDSAFVKCAEQKEESTLSDLLPSESDALLKSALEMDDLTTVDRAMSLHFMTPQTIMSIKGAIPYYETALRHLSSLLFTAQLGLVTRELREETIVTALRALDAVVSKLKVLGV